MTVDRAALLTQLVDSYDDRLKIRAARALAPFTDDPQVMDALCKTAVHTTNCRLRVILIDAMKSNPAAAGIRFSDVALNSTQPSCRKWALVNLSLLDCREAKEAVINGLNDPDILIRCAAALNSGLYTDQDVLSALECFFKSIESDPKAPKEIIVCRSFWDRSDESAFQSAMSRSDLSGGRLS